MALPKKHRMTKSDFTKRFRSGKRVRGEGLSIQFGPAQVTKIAVVVQTRAVPGAVARNRVRRQLNDYLTAVYENFSKTVWVAIIVHTKPSGVGAMKTELASLLQKSGIIKR